MTNQFKITENEIEVLKSVQNKCYEQSVFQGWHKTPREAGTMLALIHSEVSEALEGVRKNLHDSHLPHRLSSEVELADAVIRIFDFAGKYNLDIASALAEKLSYNLNRDDHKFENRMKEGGKVF